MAQITKSVDRTLVNGSEVFIYTINVEFSGLSEPSFQGKLIDFFPNKIKYILPETGGQIERIIQSREPDSTKVTFDFGNVTAGTSFSFTIACSFGPGRVPNDSFINEASLYANDVLVDESVAPVVNLVLKENFTMEKTVSPLGLVMPGDDLTFTLSIINKGDRGDVINNINIINILPPHLSPIPGSLPVGNDVPVAGYSDPTYNGKTGSVNGQTIAFNLPSFAGARYEISFKVKVSENVLPGEIITNIAKWTVDDISRPDAELKITVFSTDLIFQLIKGASRTSYVGGPITYSITNSNRGNAPIENYILEDILPPEVDINHLTFTTNTADIPSYGIYISLSDSPNNYITVMTDITTGTVTGLDLSSFIPSNLRIDKIRIIAPFLNPQSSTHSLALYGIINSTAIDDQIITNIARAYVEDRYNEATARTTLNGFSELGVQKQIIPNRQAYYPLEEFKFAITIGALNTMTIDPIIADLMPIGLRYVLDSEYYEYVDSITGRTYDSRLPGFPIPLPNREIIDDFKGTGQSLLRWSFNNFTLPQRNSIRLYLTVFVEINPPNRFINAAFEGNPGNKIYHVYNPVPDILDFDGDGITDEEISGVEISGIILTTSLFLIKKEVKGEKNLEFSNEGTTDSGGNLEYQLSVTNNQNIDLKNIEIVDILPHIGDSGVILTNLPRSSQFNIYAIGGISVEVINLLGDPVNPNPPITIEYSTSNDPIRFDQAGNPLGTGSWLSTPPSDITTLRSIRVITDPEFVLQPYERLIVTIPAKTPTGVLPGQIAYNSFATRADKIIGDGVEALLPTEPNKVSIKIASPTLGSISGIVWYDENNNGIRDNNELGINGITVELYNEIGEKISTTVTSNNTLDEPGYYSFNNLAKGTYQVKFVPLEDYSFTAQIEGIINGSNADPITGFTNPITLLEGQNREDIDAGLILDKCDPPIINACDRCIHTCDLFNPFKGVSAFDCEGNDITCDIEITKNTINTSEPGEYTLSFEVKDSAGQIGRKTITVRVIC